MTYLVQSIILCLMVALVLGFILGWLFRAMLGKPKIVIEQNTSPDVAPTARQQEAQRMVSDTADKAKRHDFIFVDR